jgi:hypothetical protein
MQCVFVQNVGQGDLLVVHKFLPEHFGVGPTRYRHCNAVKEAKTESQSSREQVERTKEGSPMLNRSFP